VRQNARVAPDSGTRRWWILAAMTGTLSMMMLDSTVVSVALPSIQADLDLSQTELQWVVNAYLLALAAFVAVAGRISDMFNRVHVTIAGIAIFVFFSAMCGLAQSDAWLISARALQGIGAAIMIPPTATIVVNTFGVDERGKAMGIYAGISMIFLSLGPLIGGVFTESLSWRWVFWINLPVGLATIAMVLWTKPEGRVEAGQRLDKLGLVTLVPGLTLLVLGFMESSNWGWGSVKTIAAIAVGAVLLVAFVLIERRARSPLVELRLFGVRNFRGDTTVLFFAQFALMGLTIFGAIFTQDVLGFTPIEAGLGMLPVTLPLLVAAPLAGRIYDRAGPRGLVTAGSLTAGIGFAVTAAVLGEQDYWLLVPGYILIGAGIGLVMSPTNTDAMSSAPLKLRGQASGTIQTVRQVGGTMGIALLGTLVANIQNDQLSDLLLGLGESEARVDSAERILAEDPAGQAEITRGLSPAEAHQVADGSQDAIVDGIAAAYWGAGGVLLIAAIVAFMVLRRMHYADDSAEATPALA
jgi:EmrB/QacA subfamily drug resistance transporter